MEIFLVVLTAALTLIGGVVLFLLGRTIEVLITMPLQEFKKSSRIALERINFYANRLTNYFSDNPNLKERELMTTISEELRVAATTLEATYLGISAREFLVKLKLIPSSGDLAKARGQLILLSNNLPTVKREKGRTAEQSPINVNHKAIEQIELILGDKNQQ